MTQTKIKMQLITLSNFGLLTILSLLVGGVFVGCSQASTVISPESSGVSIAHRTVSKLTPNQDGRGEIENTDPDQGSADKDSPNEVTPDALSSGFTQTPTATNHPTGSNDPALHIEDEAQTIIGTKPICVVETIPILEFDLINLINMERENRGLTILEEQSQLTAAARSHSDDMACHGFFSHISPDHGDALERVTNTGYQFSSVAEIIAGGYLSAELVLEGWMDSPGHKKEILDPNFSHVGVGFVRVEASTHEYYWTVLFGKPLP